MINIVFDAGHGQGRAHNRGYVGKRWKNEGDGNYYFHNLVRDRVNSYDGIHVWRTRPKISQNPSLSARARYKSDKRAFFSWHTNAYKRNQATGAEIFFWNQQKLNEGKNLANRLLRVICKTLDIPNRGLKTYPFGVLNTRNNKAKESMLIEVCFHDNDNDVTKYEARAEDLAVKLADEIVEYFGIERKPVKPTTPKKEESKGEKKMDYTIIYRNDGDQTTALALANALFGMGKSSSIVRTTDATGLSGTVVQVGGGEISGKIDKKLIGRTRADTFIKSAEFVKGL